jgi:hypothetical protein
MRSADISVQRIKPEMFKITATLVTPATSATAFARNPELTGISLLPHVDEVLAGPCNTRNRWQCRCSVLRDAVAV